MAGTPKVVVIDHYDSYTWNLVHLLARVTGVVPAIFQHDDVRPSALRDFTHVVLSPGPGDPREVRDFNAGIEILRAPSRPILGVCLGMQGIVTTYGGELARARPAHGVVADIDHDERGVFRGVPLPFKAVRYHSLAVQSLPLDLEVTATASDGTVMGVRHRRWPVEGVQFHPESVLSEHGLRMMQNFLTMS